MPRIIGYARVSTADQDLSVQRAALDGAGCAIVLEEAVSGARRQGRDQLALALQILAAGDVLAVTRLDRLGRSLRDLANIAHELEERGAALRVIEQGVDTSTSAGRAFFGMLATFAQFESDVRRERQAEGIARVKASPDVRRAKYAGRAPSVDRARVRELRAEGMKPGAIARALGVSRMSVWRALEAPRGAGSAS